MKRPTAVQVHLVIAVVVVLAGIWFMAWLIGGFIGVLRTLQ